MLTVDAGIAAVVGTLMAIAVASGDGWVWLMAGVILGAVVPFDAPLVMWPTNRTRQG